MTKAAARRSKKSSASFRVHIVNPAGGCGHLSLASARSYVRAGRADWEGSKIRFREGYQHSSAIAEATRYEVTHHGEGLGIARKDAIQGLPVVGDAFKMLHGKRLITQPFDHSTVTLSARRIPDLVTA